MKNLFIYNMNEKDVNHFTTNAGLVIRRKIDKPFKKLCEVFTNANIIRESSSTLSDDEYFTQYNTDYVDPVEYGIKKGKNNIVLERYPILNPDEPYIFVSNHTCPEDIETILNIIDRNAYLILGSIESLKYNPEMYLSFLNGMIPFDILDSQERKELMLKMERVVKTNSILIFPEGSHNFSPNKLINNLYDGPVNLSLKTGRKIVLISLLRDNNNEVSYTDVSNPIDVSLINNDILNDKDRVKSISSFIRNKIATAIYCMMQRHTKIINRVPSDNIEDTIRNQMIEDAFNKLHWNKDVFEAEYLTKKTKEELEYESVHESIYNMLATTNTTKADLMNYRDFITRYNDIHNKDVVECMRKHLNKVRTK